MNFEEFVEKYNLLQDEEGRWYYIDEKGMRFEPYASTRKIGKILGLSETGVKIRIKNNNLKPVSGQIWRSKKGKPGSLYNLNEVIKACETLTGAIHQADENGIITYRNKKYATIRTLSNQLRISAGAINRRLEQSPIKHINIIAKTQVGNLARFYEIKKIKKICSDLTTELPKGNKNGFLFYNRKKYGTIQAIAKLLKISSGAVKLKINEHKIKPIDGVYFAGRKGSFYPVKEVRLACSNLSSNKLVENPHGYVIFRKNKYANISKLSKLLEISITAIEKRIEKHKIKPIKAKGHKNKIFDYYNVASIINICTDLISIPIVNKQNVAIINGKKYATINKLSNIFNIGTNIIKNRIKKQKLKSQKIRTKDGIRYAYKIEDVKKCCADLLNKNLLIPDESGWAIHNGKKYAPLSVLANELKLSMAAIKLRITNLQPLKGKDRIGHITNFYCLKDVKKCCADLLNKNLLIPDEFGWAIHNGKKYAPLSVLANELKLSSSTLKKYMGTTIKPLKGKTRFSYRITNYYNFEDVKKLALVKTKPASI